MKLRPYKFQIVAICQKVTDDGEVVAETIVAQPDGRPAEVFGIDGLKRWADEFPDVLLSIKDGPDQAAQTDAKPVAPNVATGVSPGRVN